MDKHNRANKFGDVMEHMISCFLKEVGINAERAYRPGCQNINGGTLEVDLFIPPRPNFEKGLGVEVKWQASNGSAYQKLPYAVSNIKDAYPFPGIIVYSGPKFRTGPGAGMVRWCEQKVDDQLLAVLDSENFYLWITSQML